MNNVKFRLAELTASSEIDISRNSAGVFSQLFTDESGHLEEDADFLFFVDGWDIFIPLEDSFELG